MIVARYDLEKRIDAVWTFARSLDGSPEFIPGEVKHFKVKGKVYRLSADCDTNEWTIHDDPLPDFEEGNPTLY